MEWLAGFPTGCQVKKGWKFLALPRLTNSEQATTQSNITHNPLPGPHKVQLYNMPALDGQTIQPGIAHHTNKRGRRKPG